MSSRWTIRDRDKTIEQLEAERTAAAAKLSRFSEGTDRHARANMRFTRLTVLIAEKREDAQ